MIDLFNAHFIAGNPPPRLSLSADSVVIGNLLAEKGGNYRSEITSTQSGKMSFSPLKLFGWTERVD